ncbi:hypothetical protein ACLOJK_030354 [Asimina triloba]
MKSISKEQTNNRCLLQSKSHKFSTFYSLQAAAQEPKPSEDASLTTQIQLPPRFKRWHWWLLVILCTAFVFAGQSVGTLLTQFYFEHGGKSKWMPALLQSAGFPILFLPLLLYPSPPAASTNTTPPSITTRVYLYTSLGLLTAACNLMYSYGQLYLPISTYSLICATQLAFGALFAYFLNSEKLTPLIINSVVLLSFSSALIALRSDHDDPKKKSKPGDHAAGFLFTVGASAGFSLLLSLTQLSFDKILKSDGLSVLLDMQIYPGAAATIVCVVGLFAGGDWNHLKDEMETFQSGRTLYVMNLVWTAVAWQLYTLGYLGLILMVSSLFSNVISVLSLPIAPLAGVLIFQEKMDGVKIVAMLLAIWGFISYIYQQYLDDHASKEPGTAVVDERSDASEASVHEICSHSNVSTEILTGTRELNV